LKGRGLFTKSKIRKGQFVIEYVGEVCDEDTYQNRIQEYDGERHFYFLSLDSGFVIDASRKGNKGRFINHSCNPNCALQKWLVGRQTRIGIFAIKDIPADSELTFDYAMEVYGLARQKCYCGEKNCRGTIRVSEVILS
jgi:SET domain-containing protein